ncbi:MAG: extracellular solute-binding protein [bacterium]|nr:extracellular solute-binding protein [bacterium]
MNKKYIVVGLVLALSSLLSLQAFGEGDCNVPAPAASTEVNFIGWAFDITEFYAKELEKCNSVENLQVNVQLLNSSGAQEQVRLALAGGAKSPYGIIHAANAQIIEWGSLGWLMPLNDLVEKYKDEYNLGDISQKAWDGGTIGGKIYGVPMVGNTLHIQYRKDLFEQYGLKPPTTYDEVIAACETLKKDTSIDLPFTTNLHAGWAWEIEFLHFLRAFGGDYLNEDNTPAFNAPEGVTAVEKIMEVVNACMGAEGLTYSLDDSSAGIQSGAVAFIQIWASRAAGAIDPEQSMYADQIAFAPAAAPNPGGPLGGSAWNDYYAIPATTDIDPDLLFRLILDAADQASQMQAAEYGIVTRMTASKSGVGGPYLPAAAETIAKGVGIYQPKAAVSLVRSALGDWLPLVGNGDLSAQEALDKAAEQYTTEAIAQGFIKK